jgi:hypothetical protein
MYVCLHICLYVHMDPNVCMYVCILVSGMLGLSSGDGDVIRGQRTILRGSGGIFIGIVVGPDLIRGGYSMQRYVSSYVCM